MAEDGETVTFHWECGCPRPGEYPHIYVHTDSTNWTQRVIDFTKGGYDIGRKKYGGSMLSWKEVWKAWLREQMNRRSYYFHKQE